MRRPAHIAVGESVTEKSKTQRNPLQREQQEAHSRHRVAIETTSIDAMHATKAWPRAPHAQRHLGRGPGHHATHGSIADLTRGKRAPRGVRRWRTFCAS